MSSAPIASAPGPFDPAYWTRDAEAPNSGAASMTALCLLYACSMPAPCFPDVRIEQAPGGHRGGTGLVKSGTRPERLLPNSLTGWLTTPTAVAAAGQDRVVLHAQARSWITGPGNGVTGSYCWPLLKALPILRAAVGRDKPRVAVLAGRSPAAAACRYRRGIQARHSRASSSKWCCAGVRTAGRVTVWTVADSLKALRQPTEFYFFWASLL